MRMEEYYDDLETKIPPGLISVNWSGEFGVDLYIFLKRKEAAW